MCVLVVLLALGACASSPPAVSTNAQSEQAAQTREAGPAAAVSSPEHLAVARRFLRGFGAGELAMKAAFTEIEKRAEAQPGIAELTRRVISGIDEEDFEILAAKVYARHLEFQHLLDLAMFIETRTGSRFFKAAVDQAMSGEPRDGAAIMSQFNADELTEIMKFSNSKAFLALQERLSVINEDMAQAGGELGEALLKDYLSKN